MIENIALSALLFFVVGAFANLIAAILTPPFETPPGWLCVVLVLVPGISAAVGVACGIALALKWIWA